MQEKIKELEKQIKQIEAIVETSFIKDFAKQVEKDEKLAELMLSNLEGFLKEYEKSRSEYIEKNTISFKEEKGKLEKELQAAQFDKSIKEVEKKVKEKYPNADLSQVYDYIENDLSPREQEKLSKLTLEEALIKIIEKIDNKEEALPQKIDEINNANDISDLNNEDLPMNRK